MDFSKSPETNKPIVPEVNGKTPAFRPTCAPPKVLNMGDSKSIEKVTCELQKSDRAKVLKAPTSATRSSDDLDTRKGIAIGFVLVLMVAYAIDCAIPHEWKNP